MFWWSIPYWYCEYRYARSLSNYTILFTKKFWIYAIKEPGLWLSRRNCTAAMSTLFRSKDSKEGNSRKHSMLLDRYNLSLALLMNLKIMYTQSSSWRRRVPKPSLFNLMNLSCLRMKAMWWVREKDSVCVRTNHLCTNRLDACYSGRPKFNPKLLPDCDSDTWCLGIRS